MMRYGFLLLLVIIFFCESNAQQKTLDDFISIALTNSPLLKDYKNQAQANAYDSLLIRAGFQPQVGATAQALYAPAFNNFGYDSAITNGGNYSGLITVNQSLFNKKNRNAHFQSIELLNQSLAVNSKITEVDLKLSITSQYITAYSDYSQVLFNQSLVDLLNNEQAILKPLVEHGVYLQTDYLNLSVNISAQKIVITQAMMQYKVDLYLLNYLCGIVDTSTVILSNPQISVSNTFDISNTPTMMQFHIDSLKSINSKLLIDLNYRPKLSAFGDAGFQSVNPKNIPDNFGASVGLNFSMPIYDGRQRKTQYSKISLTENTRMSYRDFYTLQFQQKINQLRGQLKETDDLISEIKNQLAEEQNLIDLYKIEIEKGLVRFTDFILVINNYINTKNTLTQSENNRMQIVNQLNYIK
ncbi:MAG: TolC family protein [Bacteroidia bacterium]